MKTGTASVWQQLVLLGEGAWERPPVHRGGGASPPLHCPARARAPVRTPEAAPAGYLPRSPEGAALLWFCLFVCVCAYCDFAKYSRTRDTKSWSPRTRERSFWFKHEMERNPEVPSSTRDEALLYYTIPSGVPRGPSQLHSISVFSEAP